MDISRRKFVLSTLLMAPMIRLFARNYVQDNKYFGHGVASGDPLQDRVIIWTRISSSEYLDKRVKWEVALDKDFAHIEQQGVVLISADSDYTVKIDVKRLSAGTNYYYRFLYQGVSSVIGTTRTLPDSLKETDFTMAVVSCNNWEDGYFNAFRFLAQKKEVDLVLHLGDYIYEYASGQYGNPKSGRINQPLHEIVTLKDYRTRYAQYRTDVDLQHLHATKPFYVLFDDHELANDASCDGAQNHQSSEGSWKSRKEYAIQAYLEWMPIRAKAASDVRRKFVIGNDISLYMMDERSYRTKQLKLADNGFMSDKRTLIGQAQYRWLASELKKSKTTWNLIANQVMFSGYTVREGFKLPKYNDWWLGYPFERAKLIEMLGENQIRNPLFLTGDHHESFVLAVNKEDGFMQYDKPYQEKPLAWEFLTPSITSKNADRKSQAEIAEFEKMLYDKQLNPHMVYCDIKSHGYFIATINQNEYRADYFFVDQILTKDAKEYRAAGFCIDAASFMLKKD